MVVQLNELDERQRRMNTGEERVLGLLDQVALQGEDYSFLDPEPITGHTLLEEIRFSLYATQAELTRLEKLLDTYEDVSRLQR